MSDHFVTLCIKGLFISITKQNYHCKFEKKTTLEIVLRSSKVYWSILKNVPNSKTILIIRPLNQQNELVKDFNKTAELVNSFFV